ncbi:DUF2771 domain-containing protein [Nocardia huaxiensis]|uniref:DUF2771 domain-containing protein n=1 Tax=Nocardia huaxiensis TaxID=2755382 RepID=A0A7D6VKI6_9NOCA|nr:DUF2771 domain-containing protein [Nocardia huaxiensis]QLY31650.1 DUF2771 domain-containing protein [Nocardia huaxiensis]UFS95202.1 DUF2771 domain-containing protein [Nocardia huaxiensis]
MSKPNARTIAALAGAALLVFVAAVAAVVALAVKDAPEPKPEITAYAHGESVTVEPYMFCNTKMQDCRVLPADIKAEELPDGIVCNAGTDCRTGTFAELAVPAGYPLQLSLPRQVVEAPWLLTAVYQLPDGRLMKQQFMKTDFETEHRELSWTGFKTVKKSPTAITIPSAKELPLVGIELDLPILARDMATGEEGYIPHAAWSVRVAS